MPDPPAGLILRPRLLERLSAGRPGSLTLLGAPAVLAGMAAVRGLAAPGARGPPRRAGGDRGRAEGLARWRPVPYLERPLAAHLDAVRRARQLRLL